MIDIKQLGNRFPCLIQNIASRSGAAMPAAARIAANTAQTMVNSLIDSFGFRPGCSRIIKIDHTIATIID
ncbi:hypothetical protein SDC9_126879 [bioreactor metagenome]|uniref:Uncharacterized protein n=1 Tax=bioreactor metagenome TaxID=1076179 RepID=A0A645CSD7_9ZZZZ